MEQDTMKREESFGCRAHHRVFFSAQELKEHIKEKCHPENIVKLEDEDFLGQMSYNIISQGIKTSKLSEEEKEGQRRAYLW